MDAGITVDYSRTSARQSGWHPGPPRPQEDRILGLNLAPDGAVEVDPDRVVPILTWRCPRCGLLESYAPDGSS